MSNILKFKNKENFVSKHPLSRNYSMIFKLYNSLINSGFSSCEAFHEAMKLLIILNPHIKLSELSQKTFDIIYPIYDNYYENNIDNHSQN